MNTDNTASGPDLCLEAGTREEALSEKACQSRPEKRSRKYTRQWEEYIRSHLPQSKMSAYKTTLAVQDSPLKYEIPGLDETVPVYTRTLQIPKMFTMEDKQRFEEICSTMYAIFEKTIDAYKQDPKVRRLFRFGPGLNHLILQDPGYPVKIPMLRVDIFYNEETGDFRFCEFNTDGTSAMFENDTMYDFLSLNNAWNHFQPDHEYMPLMDTWADAFLQDVKEAGFEGDPVILITDILENAYLPELYAFEKLFQKRGLQARVVDIRDVCWDGEHLYDPKDGLVFDAVYRRAVTKDVISHSHDCADFLRAVYHNDVILIGGFQTQIPHSKAISEALFAPELQKYFTQEEIAFIEKHVPRTWDLKQNIAGCFLKDRSRWILKPKDGYAAKGVWAGVDVPEALWKKLIYDSCGMDYIVQEYVTHYHTGNFDLLHDDRCKPYANLTGLYVYNGKFAGVYSRLSDAGIVSTQYNERMVPTIFLKDSPAAVKEESAAGTEQNRR